MSDLEEKKKEDAWFQELNKRTTEREKKYIIGTDGKPILDSFGYPIIIKQTINFKTSDNSKKGWLYITQNNEYYFQDYNKTITKIKYIFKDKNDNIYFEDNEGNYYIEDKIININKTTDKIIKVLHKKPDKISSASKFLNYYLPVTIKILERYDEIEEQKLNSSSSRDFENKVNQMISNIEIAFDNQLNNLYNEEFIDTNAEIKVFEAMLKSDGLLGESINTKKDGDINE